MEQVTGIGGLFFRARDPDALARWYAEHLGIDPAPATYEQRPWWQQQGPTVFSPFPAGTEYFGRPEQAWKLNLRVRDLDAMIAQLRAAGIEVTPQACHSVVSRRMVVRVGTRAAPAAAICAAVGSSRKVPCSKHSSPASRPLRIDWTLWACPVT